MTLNKRPCLFSKRTLFFGVLVLAGGFFINRDILHRSGRVSRYELLGRRGNERGGVRLPPNAGGLTALIKLFNLDEGGSSQWLLNK